MHTGEISILPFGKIQTTGLRRARLVTNGRLRAEKHTRVREYPQPVVVRPIRDHFVGAVYENHRLSLILNNDDGPHNHVAQLFYSIDISFL